MDFINRSPFTRQRSFRMRQKSVAGYVCAGGCADKYIVMVDRPGSEHYSTCPSEISGPDVRCLRKIYEQVRTIRRGQCQESRNTSPNRKLPELRLPQQPKSGIETTAGAGRCQVPHTPSRWSTEASLPGRSECLDWHR